MILIIKIYICYFLAKQLHMSIGNFSIFPFQSDIVIRSKEIMSIKYINFFQIDIYKSKNKKQK